MDQDSIIVYRNPLEKMFWENSGTYLPFMLVFAVLSVITFIAVHKLITHFGKWGWREPKWVMVVCWAVSLSVGFSIPWFLFI